MVTTEEVFEFEGTDLDEAIKSAVDDAYRAEGYVKTEADGEEVIDKKSALHEAIYRAVKGAVVKEEAERSEKALTKGQLAKLVFPSAPGATSKWDELDLVQQEAWKILVSNAWNPTNPNFSGPVQRLVGARDRKLVLIRTRTTVGGTPGVDCVYLTSSEELIFYDFVTPLKSSVRRAAERLAKNAAMVSTRNKELTERTGREVDSGMKAATKLAQSTLELES